jgi:hypothetical protein
LGSFKATGDLQILGHQLVRVTVVDFNCVRILAVEVVVTGNDLLDRDLPGLSGGLALAPPGLFPVELGNGQGLGAGVGLVARRVRVLEEPDLLGRPAFFKEQDIGIDAGVGRLGDYRNRGIGSGGKG